MFNPSGFRPSFLARMMQSPMPEEKLDDAEFVDVRREEISPLRIDLYTADAEHPDAVAPFLARNKAKDLVSRQYEIRPGGVAVYYTDSARPSVDVPGLRTKLKL